MISFAATFRPFVGAFKDVQLNAIKSWLRFCPPCEVIMLGDDEGVAEVASMLNLTYIPDIERNRYGTPLLNSLLNKAESAAKNDIICYINSDIIILDNPLQILSISYAEDSGDFSYYVNDTIYE